MMTKIYQSMGNIRIFRILIKNKKVIKDKK